MKRNFSYIPLVLLLIIPDILAFNQEYNQEMLTAAEIRLQTLFLQSAATRNEEKRELINKEIELALFSSLQSEASFNYPFDSLKHLGKIKSGDNRVRLYTWNLPYNDGTHIYFGYIQYKPEKSDKMFLFRLNDNRMGIENPDAQILPHDNWLGALYYEIIECRGPDKGTYYTLIGFDFNNVLSSKKMVDALWFNQGHQPYFGKPVFRYNNRLRNRVIFEYSARATMGLKYHPDRGMIIYDHLSPSRPSYQDLHQFYGPDFSYDAFHFSDGIWNEVRDIDVRNPMY